MEDNIKKDNEKEVNPKVEEKTKSETVKNEHEPIKLKIGTVGNFILAALAILIVGTGALTYYLIHTAKEDYDKQYSEIVANISNIVNETEDENVIPIGNLIDSAISDVTGQSSNTVTTDASNTRKTLNEELVVLYNGLILDTTKMDEVTLQYIDSTNKDADKYVITYYNYENYSFKDAKLGTLSTQVYEGLVKMENVGSSVNKNSIFTTQRQIHSFGNPTFRHFLSTPMSVQCEKTKTGTCISFPEILVFWWLMLKRKSNTTTHTTPMTRHRSSAVRYQIFTSTVTTAFGSLLCIMVSAY